MMKKISLTVLMLLMIGIPADAQALLKSASYIIYETVQENADGPVISGVAATAGQTSATVSWDTDITADGFVVYDTADPFTASKEQGSSAKVGTNQSVTLVGLAAGTTYYYQVKSESLYGGSTLDSTVRSFTTAAAPVPPPAPGPGGGVVVIDKTDKFPPKITDAKVDKILSDTATISWQTDEDATSFAEYGRDEKFGGTYGTWEAVKSHAVTIANLLPETSYLVRALSSDAWGNLASSTALAFTTLSFEEAEKIKEETATTTEKEPTVTDFSAALDRARELISKLYQQVSVSVLESNLTKHVTALEFFNQFLPAPLFTAEPRVEVDATTATIAWQTDVDASGQVAYAPEDAYKPGAAEPYISVVGNAQERTKTHEVKLIGLLPNTLYHYQLRSKGLVGPQGKSRDFNFRTKKQELEITSFSVKVLSPESAQFRWITSAETDSSLRYIPYRGNVLTVDEAKSVSDETMSVIHEMKVENLEGGVIYDVELSGKDSNGRVASKMIQAFVTTKDNLPPQITQVRTDSVISPGKEERIQVIISWTTNEPATSLVYYQKGIGPVDQDPLEKTQLDANYTKKHVAVLTRFEPGQVYSFKVESADSVGNGTKSQMYSILTPKKKETIFDIILRILEETFGWIGTMRK